MFHLSSILAVSAIEGVNESGDREINGVQMSFSGGEITTGLFDGLDDFLAIAQESKPSVYIDPQLRSHLLKVKWPPRKSA
jgi:hypothetical protein